MKMSFFVFALFVFFLFGCTKNPVVFEQYQIFEDTIWEKENELTFDLLIKDNLADYKVDIVFMHTLHYGFTNIYLSMSIITPDESERISSYQYFIKDTHGRYIGEEADGLFTIRNPALKRTAFHQTGTYRVVLRHLMPFEEIRGIYKAGIVVRKIENSDE